MDLRLVRRWNLHGRIRIHTVAVHGGQVQAFLRRLAEENGGRWFNL